MSVVNTSAQSTQRVRYNVFNSNNGLGKQVIKAITEDKNGFIWLLSDHQLQWFDGSNFHQVPFGKGIHQIPGSLFYELHQGLEKDIWIFYNYGYSIYNPETFSFKHYSLPNQKVNWQEQVFVSRNKRDIIIFNNGNYQIINSKTRQISKIIKKTSRAIGLASNYNTGQLEFFTEDKSGIHIENIEKNTQITIPNPQQVQYYIYKRVNDSTVLAFAEKHFLAYDIKHYKIIKQSPYPFGFGMKSFIKNKDFIDKNNNTLLIIMENEIWEFDKSSLCFTNKLVSLNGTSMLNQGYYNSIFIDSKGVLWASTTLNGLQKVLLQKQPIKLFASPTKEENFIKCFFPDKKNNAIICGTFGAGLIIYDTIGNIIKKYPLKNPDTKTGTIVTSIIELDEFTCLIMLYGRNDYYILNRKNLSINSIKANYENKELAQAKPNYYSIPLKVSSTDYLYNLGNLKLSIKYLNGAISIEKNKNRVSLNKLPLFPIYTKYEALLEISSSSFIRACLQKVGLIETSLVYIDKKNKNWILGTSNGLYEFSSNAILIKSYTTKNGLANNYIYAGIIDNDKNLWCSHDKGISKIDSNGIISNLSKPDGLQDDEFNYGAIAKTDDGELFFGGINGLNSFYPNELNSNQDNSKLVITKISSNEPYLPEDTAFWNLNNLEFKHTNNRIKIQLSTIGNSTATSYNYQYRLIGIDKEWKNLNNTSEINLALNPGKYKLEILSGRFFNKRGLAQKRITLTIFPPTYLRWWFLLLFGGISVLTIWFAAKYITNRKYRKKMQAIEIQEQLEFERQRISRDLHDNMGAYTSALMANVEKLKIIQGNIKELDKIQNNAEHILNSLRETIWVLNNKEIDIANFSDEFKNYCFKILRNFDNISFEAIENLEKSYLLKASDAINLNKILQEAFQNIIKHSKATRICFTIHASDKLSMTLNDNGIGLDKSNKLNGNGLENMEWRANESNARLSIFSEENKGTTISIVKDMLHKEY
ncbi:histidine kinase [Sediminibacterium sp.]|uniref:sensor histidine kinase n=1 Tax=Sediminibacterium sp. TaxID=1917865 RepID=UPI003F6E823B